MGIFSNKCDALIDPATGRALTGDKLAQAKQDPDWPRCGNKVSKRARFCNKCTSPAPGGWWKCPSCRKWIGNDSSCCPHCGTALYPESRPGMSGGVWQKDAGLFAQRFEIGDVKRLLNHDLQIQAGTAALMLDGGKFKGMLEAGIHKPDSLGRKINWFGNPPPRTVVMVDVGDVIIPLRVDNLRTSEQYPIEFYGEIIVRFRNKNKSALAFLENRLKEKKTFSYADMSDVMAGEVRHAVDSLCVKSTVDDLVRDPRRRLRLRDEMENSIRPLLERSGIELIRVSSAEFSGDEYEEYAEKQGELEVKRREVEYSIRMREMLSKERMEQVKSETELLEYEESLAHEHDIAGEKRGREKELLLRGWKHQDELEDLRHQLLVEMETTTHDIDIKVKWDDYQRDKRVADETAKDEVWKIQHEQEKTETAWAMDLREQKNKQKLELKEAEAKRRKNMSLEERLMDVEDPEIRKDLLAVFDKKQTVEEMKQQETMTPEQILAAAAARNPQLAESLARMKNVSEEKYRELLDEVKRLYQDAGDRIDRNLKTTIEPAIEAAKRKDGSQTIVK